MRSGAFYTRGEWFYVYVDRDFAEADIVELLYNWLFYGIVENFVCRMWESWSLLFHVL